MNIGGYNRSFLIVIICILIVILSLSVGCIEQLFPSEKAKVKKREKELRVNYGDLVRLDYTGKYEAVDGRWLIFETTLESIGTDPTLLKAYTFEWANKQRDYGSINLNVGDGRLTPKLGFDANLIGMREGETRQFRVYPSRAWGEPQAELIRVLPRVESVPLFESISKSEFSKHYRDESLEPGLVLNHYFWHWQIIIIDVTETEVYFMHDPYGNLSSNETVNINIQAYPNWNSTVKSIVTEKNLIYVEHIVTVDSIGDVVDAKKLAIYNTTFEDIERLRADAEQPRDSLGIITEVTPTSIIIDFNYEPVGKILEYEVTVHEIIR